jgi:hypothetical protein
MASSACDPVLAIDVTRWLFPARWEHPIEGDADLNSATPAVAFVPYGDPVEAPDFDAAAWEPGVWEAQGEQWYIASILVGPGQATVLTPGRWVAWFRVTRGVEVVHFGPFGPYRVI